MKKLIVALSCLTLSTASFAGELVQSVDLGLMHINADSNAVFVQVPGCTKYAKIDLATIPGKAMYTTVLTATASKKKVSIEFKEESCSGDSATIQWLRLLP